MKNNRSSAAAIAEFCPSSCEGGFDGKALGVSNVLRGPAKHLSSRRESCLLRRYRINAPRNCIRFQQIPSTLEFDLPEQTALAPAKIVRTGTLQAAVPSSSRITR